MVVGRSHKSEAKAPAQPLINGVAAVARAHIVVVGEGGRLAHGAAMLRADLNERGHGIVVLIPANAAVAGRIADVVGDRQRPHPGIAQKLGRGDAVDERQAVLRGHDVVVAIAARVHLIGLEGHKALGVCRRNLGAHLLPVRPQLLKALPVEIDGEGRLLIARIDIRPHRVPGHRAEVEVRRRARQRIFLRAIAIGDAAVVVDIPPIDVHS